MTEILIYPKKMHSYNKLGPDNKNVNGYGNKVSSHPQSYQSLMGCRKESWSTKSLCL